MAPGAGDPPGYTDPGWDSVARCPPRALCAAPRGEGLASADRVIRVLAACGSLVGVKVYKWRVTQFAGRVANYKQKWLLSHR